MAIPSSGPISMAALRSEFANFDATAANAPISLGDLYRRSFANTSQANPYADNNNSTRIATYVVDSNDINTSVPTSGALSFSNFYSSAKSFIFAKYYGTQTNVNIRNEALTNGWDGSKPLTWYAEITPGSVVYATSTGVWAFDTGTGSAGSKGWLLNRSGSIRGAGGNGGGGGADSNGSGIAAGSAGGPAFIARMPTTLQNAGAIYAGGGGGGGGGAGYYDAQSGKTTYQQYTAGGGGGGGAGQVGGSGGAGGSGGGGAGSAGGWNFGGSGGGPSGSNAGSGGAGGVAGSSGSSGGNGNRQGGYGGGATNWAIYGNGGGTGYPNTWITFTQLGTYAGNIG